MGLLVLVATRKMSGGVDMLGLCGDLRLIAESNLLRICLFLLIIDHNHTVSIGLFYTYIIIRFIT